MNRKTLYIYSVLLTSGAGILFLDYVVLGMDLFAGTIPSGMVADGKVSFILILALFAKYWIILLLTFIAHLLVLIVMGALWKRVLLWYGILFATVIVDSFIPWQSIIFSDVLVSSIHTLLIVFPCIWILREKNKSSTFAT